jgi:MYXO-CTERM domain-containing protein
MRLLIVAALLLVSLPGRAATFQAGSSGLQGYWPLDSVSGGTTPDLSGNALDLGVNGPVVLSPGAFGNALNFDNTDDSLSRADAAPLNVGSGSFTVAAFVRPSGTTQDRIVNKWNGTMGWLIDVNETTGGNVQAGYLRMRLSDGSNNLDHPVDGALGTGAWRHIAGVVDRGAGQLRLYVDGAQVGASGTLPAGLGSLSNAAQLGVGNIPAAGGNYLGGGLDEIRLYNRALSVAEIQVLAAGVPGPVLTSAVAGPGSVDLAWTAPAGGATSYTVLRSSTSGSGYTTIGSGVTGTTTTDAGATPGVPSYYIVVAETSVGPSRPSNELSATALEPPPPPPRYDDHEEGGKDDQCACGTLPASTAPWTALLGLAAILGARRRKR